VSQAISLMSSSSIASSNKWNHFSAARFLRQPFWLSQRLAAVVGGWWSLGGGGWVAVDGGGVYSVTSVQPSMRIVSCRPTKPYLQEISVCKLVRKKYLPILSDNRYCTTHQTNAPLLVVRRLGVAAAQTAWSSLATSQSPAERPGLAARDQARRLPHPGAARGAGFKSLGEPWADTTSAHGRLTVTILAGVAEFERELILQRTNEGRARAMAEGRQFGRKPKLTKHQAREALKRVAAGEPLREIALSFNDHSTISPLKARHAC
jgi:hypothetical protein